MLPDLTPELSFQTSRSGGPGGQNVNKVSSKVEVWFSIQDSQLLSPEQKEKLLHKLASRLTKEGLLHVSSQEDRSQLRNKEIVVQKVHQILEQALQREKPRHKTRPTKSSVQERLSSKKKLSLKKSNRRGDGYHD